MEHSEDLLLYPQVALDMGNSLLKFGLRIPTEESFLAKQDPEFQSFLETTTSRKI